MTIKQRRVLAAIIVPVHLASAALAWRDLSRRTDDQIRGNKTMWRVLVLMNTGNSLIYWLFGRR